MSEEAKEDRGYYTVWLDENKKFHKLDGPALEQKDGHKEWWIEGRFYHSRERWFNSLSEEDQISYLFKLGEK